MFFLKDVFIIRTEIFPPQIELVPCNKSGKELSEDEVFVEDPSELEGKEVYFKLKIENAMGLPSKFTVSFF